MTQSPNSIQFASKTTMAVALGVNRNTVQTWTGKPDFPGGSRGPWRLDAVVPWIMGRQLRRAPVDDPLLDGPDSPALERYRAARASLSEIELQQRQRQLINVDEFCEWWTAEIAAPIRRAVEALNCDSDRKRQR